MRSVGMAPRARVAPATPTRPIRTDRRRWSVRWRAAEAEERAPIGACTTLAPRNRLFDADRGPPRASIGSNGEGLRELRAQCSPPAIGDVRGPVRLNTASWRRKALIESAGLPSARARSAGGTRTTAQIT